MECKYVMDQATTVHVLGPLKKTLCCSPTGHWHNLDSFPEDGALCEFCALYMLPEYIVDRYHLPTLARLCRVLGSPVKSGLASIVWQLSNTASMPIPLAHDFMRACGYVPFQGFPLRQLRTPDLESLPTTPQTGKEIVQ